MFRQRRDQLLGLVFGEYANAPGCFVRLDYLSSWCARAEALAIWSANGALIGLGTFPQRPHASEREIANCWYAYHHPLVVEMAHGQKAA